MNREIQASASVGTASGGMIDVDCRACGAATKVPAGQHGALRCGKCGAAGDKVSDRFASRMYRDREGRPLRIRDLYAAGQELRLWCSRCHRAHEVRFPSAHQIEAALSAINPTIGEVCRHLVCPDSGLHGMVSVAAAPVAAAQLRLPLYRRPRSA